MFDKDYDIIVCGGGLAGCAAAYRASKQGLNVLLIERYGFLGGMATAAKINVWMRHWTGKPEMLWWRNKNRLKELKYKDLPLINRGFFELIKQKLLETNDLDDEFNVLFNDEMLKINLQELMLESKVNLLYHVFLVGANVDAEGKVKAITVATKDGIKELTSTFFIDATGDADLAYYGGFKYEMGREKDQLCQPMTLCFKIENVNYDMDWRDLKDKVNTYYTQAYEAGKFKNTRNHILLYKHFDEKSICFNATRILGKRATDPLELSEAEIEGKQQVKELYLFLRDHVEEFKNGRLSEIGANIGIRESRRITGNYVLNEDDILSCKKFEDSIARGCYGIDVHHQDGRPGGVITEVQEDDYYTVPYQSCIPIGSENLFIVGRPISTTNHAHGAIRVMPITTSIGDGIGLCAAYALKHKKQIKEVDIKQIHKTMDDNDMLY